MIDGAEVARSHLVSVSITAQHSPGRIISDGCMPHNTTPINTPHLGLWAGLKIFSHPPADPFIESNDVI